MNTEDLHRKTIKSLIRPQLVNAPLRHRRDRLDGRKYHPIIINIWSEITTGTRSNGVRNIGS